MPRLAHYRYQVDPIKNVGTFFSPIQGGPQGPDCATRDIAALAAELLPDPSWSGQDHVAVLGPEDLLFGDLLRRAALYPAELRVRTITR